MNAPKFHCFSGRTYKYNILAQKIIRRPGNIGQKALNICWEWLLSYKEWIEKMHIILIKAFNKKPWRSPETYRRIEYALNTEFETVSVVIAENGTSCPRNWRAKAIVSVSVRFVVCLQIWTIAYSLIRRRKKGRIILIETRNSSTSTNGSNTFSPTTIRSSK